MRFASVVSAACENRLEQAARNFPLNRAAADPDLGRHHRTQNHEVHEIQLPPIPPPARNHAAVDRHLNSAGALRKRPDVDLASTGLVRAVSDPFPVGRNLWIPLVGLGLEDRFRLVLRRLFDSAETLQISPDRFRVASPVDEPIGRPAHRHRGKLELDQQILPARVVRELDIEPPLAVPPEAKAIRVPSGDQMGEELSCAASNVNRDGVCFRRRRSRYPRHRLRGDAPRPACRRAKGRRPPIHPALPLVRWCPSGRPSGAADRRWGRPSGRGGTTPAACRCGSFR